MAPQKQKATPRRAPGRGADAVGAAPRAQAVTTFRIYRDQLIGLQREALDRRAVGRAGRADASAILREILDNYFKQRRSAAKRPSE